MTNDEVINVLKQAGAILTDDHLVYTSGKHGSVYVNKDALYPHIAETSQLCEELARRIVDWKPAVVAAPALGGIVLTQWVAYHVGELTGTSPLAVYAEKAGDSLVLKRGYDHLVEGKRVVVLEDILNTGGSAKKAVDVVRAAGGDVVGLAVLVNRQPATVTSEMFGIPLITLAEFPAEAYDADQCPLCAAGRPINTKIGHGKKLLEAKGKA